MNSFKVTILVVLCVGLLGSLVLAEQHDYADFPLHNWVMIGFPVTPTEQNPDSVWGPFFGGSQGDDQATNTLWRFSRWLAEYDTYIRWGELERDTAGVYTNIGDPTAIIPGWGYWFYQTQVSDTTFIVSGDEAPDSNYWIPIDPPQSGHRGRTMVGNPFTFPIDWKNTRVIVNYSTDTLTMDLSLLEANDMGLIDQHAYPWNMGLISGQDTGYIPYNATTGGEIPKLQGFWVEQLNDYAQYLIKYHVNHIQNDRICKFHQACHGHPSDQDDLGADGIPETDRFIMVVRSPVDDIEVTTKASGNASVTFTNWRDLADGTKLTNSDGFEIFLIERTDHGNNKYTLTFDVRATIDEDLGWDKAMEQVEFDFGRNSTVLYPVAPNANNQEYPIIPWSPTGNGNAGSYTALRTIENQLGQSTNLSLTLKVPPTDVSLQKRVQHYTPYSVIETVTERDWVMPIGISSTDGQFTDNFNAIGILTDACDGYDVNDVTQQSPPDAYVEIYFPHNDINDYYHYWFERPVSVCYDMRSDSAHKGWKMAVGAYDAPNQLCTIRWDASVVNSEWTLTLYDSDFNVLIEDMKTVSEYTVTTQNSASSVDYFYIASNFVPGLLGVNSETVPETYSVLQNYPNPFNPTTTIRYYVPQNDWVELAIYNLQGELVKTLWSGDKAVGDYQVQWNGTDNQGRPVASGVYLTKLLTPTMARSNKMLLLK